MGAWIALPWGISWGCSGWAPLGKEKRDMRADGDAPYARTRKGAYRVW